MPETLTAEPEAERRIAIVMGADVAGYSRLMGEDEAGTLTRLTECRRAIDELVERHLGRIVGSAGDGFLAEFPSAVEAAGCAAEIQRALVPQNETLPEDRRMLFRIGINVGDVLGR